MIRDLKKVRISNYQFCQGKVGQRCVLDCISPLIHFPPSEVYLKTLETFIHLQIFFHNKQKIEKYYSICKQIVSSAAVMFL